MEYTGWPYCGSTQVMSREMSIVGPFNPVVMGNDSINLYRFSVNALLIQN